MERYSYGLRRLILRETQGRHRSLGVDQARQVVFNHKHQPSSGEHEEMLLLVGRLQELKTGTIVRFTMYKTSTPSMVTMNGCKVDTASNSHWLCVVRCRGKILSAQTRQPQAWMEALPTHLGQTIRPMCPVRLVYWEPET